MKRAYNRQDPLHFGFIFGVVGGLTFAIAGTAYHYFVFEELAWRNLWGGAIWFVVSIAVALWAKQVKAKNIKASSRGNKAAKSANGAKGKNTISANRTVGMTGTNSSSRKKKRKR